MQLFLNPPGTNLHYQLNLINSSMCFNKNTLLSLHIHAQARYFNELYTMPRIWERSYCLTIEGVGLVWSEHNCY